MMERNFMCAILKMSDFFWLQNQSNTYHKGVQSSVHSLIPVLREVTVLLNGIFGRHFGNRSYQIKGTDFDQSYSAVAYSD